MANQRDENQERKLAALLLLLEARARRRFRLGLRGVIEPRIPQIANLYDAMRVGSVAANDIARLVRNETVLARSEAAQAGFKTAERELSAIGKALEAMPQTPYRGPIPGSGIYTPEALGQRAADDFATKLETRIVSAANDAAAEARAAIRSAADAIRVRLDTIAATENADAFSKARTDAMQDFVQNLEREGLQNAVMHRWCAILDKGTCELCASLDGEVAPAGQAFRGYEPGSVHARCRCYSIPYSVFDSKRVAA